MSKFVENGRSRKKYVIIKEPNVGIVVIYFI